MRPSGKKGKKRKGKKDRKSKKKRGTWGGTQSKRKAVGGAVAQPFVTTTPCPQGRCLILLLMLPAAWLGLGMLGPGSNLS